MIQEIQCQVWKVAKITQKVSFFRILTFFIRQNNFENGLKNRKKSSKWRNVTQFSIVMSYCDNVSDWQVRPLSRCHVVGLYLQQFKAYSKLVFSLHKTKLPWRGEFSRGCKLTLVLFWTWYRCFLCQVCRNNEKSFTSQHGVWKSQKKSH